MTHSNLQDNDSILVFGERPTEAPEGYQIWNAPRPLFGSPTEPGGPAATWEGDFLSGIFYAAVDVEGDDLAESWIQQNRKLDGVIVEYASTRIAHRLLEAIYRNRFADRPDILERILSMIQTMPEAQVQSEVQEKLYRKPHGELLTLLDSMHQSTLEVA